MLTPHPVDLRAQGELFIGTRMAKTHYTKPALTYQAQLRQLKDRGLVVEDENKALHILQYISYFRLSDYWYPFLAKPKTSHIFKPRTTFDAAFKLYCFDRELRQLVSSELEKIEVALRSNMIYLLSHTYGAFWYSNPYLFNNVLKHNESLGKIAKEYEKNDEEFIKSFKQKYADPLPPCWMILEISPFGTLSHLYKNLRPKHDKRAVAAVFGLDHSVFESWLHAIVYVRNVCAHHSRLWNRVLGITPALPKKPKHEWISITTRYSPSVGGQVLINNKVYYILCMIMYLLNTINPGHHFKNKVMNLLRKYPSVDIKAMGAPEGWEDEKLWN